MAKNLLIFHLVFLTFLNFGVQDPVDPYIISYTNRFTEDLYEAINETEKGNFLINPVSNVVILNLLQSMLDIQKDFETFREIACALRCCYHFPPLKKLGAVEELFSERHPIFPLIYYKLDWASKIYVTKNIAVPKMINNPRDIFVRFFRTYFENVDFSQREQVVSTMNEWVEKNTRNKTHNLVETQDIQENTSIVAVNSLHLGAYWMCKFNKTYTKKRPFYVNDTHVVQVDTMFLERKLFQYDVIDRAHLQFLQMPTADPSVTLFIILGRKQEWAKMDEEVASRVFHADELPRALVTVQLPKFKIETRLDMKPILEKMGVHRLFTKQAHLGFAREKKGGWRLDKMLQKYVLTINEFGINTPVPRGTSYRWKDPVDMRGKRFIVDHPFIFYLRLNNIIVYAGRIVDPTQ